MIVCENIPINGREYVRTYSDAGRYVIRDGISYSEAIDPVEYGRVYTEGELLPPEEQDNNTAGPEDYENALAEMGVDFSD